MWQVFAGAVILLVGIGIGFVVGFTIGVTGVLGSEKKRMDVMQQKIVDAMAERLKVAPPEPVEPDDTRVQ